MRPPTHEEIVESIQMISVIGFLSFTALIVLMPIRPSDFGDDKPILKRFFGFLRGS